MSFLINIHGNYGDEKRTSGTKECDLGTRMILPDGRVFAYARASATALVAGKLYQSPGYHAGTADVAYIDKMTAATAAVGDRSIVVTAGGSAAIAANWYDDGYLFTASSANSGVGEVYKIDSVPAATCAATTTVTLKSNDKFNTAILGGTTKVGIAPNEFNNVLLVTNNSTHVGVYAGIPTVAVAASAYCWLQRRGAVCAFTAATVLTMGKSVASNTNAVGAIGAFVVAGSAFDANWVQHAVIGYCLNSAGTAENFGLIYLTLD